MSPQIRPLSGRKILSSRVSVQSVCCQTHKNTSKMRKSCCLIDCTNRLNKKLEILFYQVRKATEKKEQMDRCNSQIELKLENDGIAVSSLIFG